MPGLFILAGGGEPAARRIDHAVERDVLCDDQRSRSELPSALAAQHVQALHRVAVRLCAIAAGVRHSGDGLDPEVPVPARQVLQQRSRRLLDIDAIIGIATCDVALQAMSRVRAPSGCGLGGGLHVMYRRL